MAELDLENLDLEALDTTTTPTPAPAPATAELDLEELDLEAMGGGAPPSKLKADDAGLFDFLTSSDHRPARTYPEVGAQMIGEGVAVGPRVLKSAGVGLAKTYGDPTVLKEEAKGGWEQIKQANVEALDKDFSPADLHPLGYMYRRSGPMLKGGLGVLKALGLIKAGEEASESALEDAPPVPETQSVLANVLGSMTGQVVAPAGAEVMADPTLPIGVGKQVIKGAKSLTKAFQKATTNAKAFNNPIQAVNTIEKLPGSGAVSNDIATIMKASDEDVAMFAGEGVAPGGAPLPESQITINQFEQTAKGEAPTSLKKVFRGEQPKPPKNADPKLGIRKIQSIKDVPTEKIGSNDDMLISMARNRKALTNPETAPRAISEKSALSLMDNVDRAGVEASQMDALMGLSTQESLSGLRWFDKVFSNPARILGRPVERMNRVADRVVEVTNQYNEQISSILATLKKKGRMGRWVRDKQAELRVSKALDGDFDMANQLTGKELTAYKASREMLNKLADLQGLPTDMRLSDYFPHIITDERALARYRKTGEIMDPDTGVNIKPTKDPFLKKRTAGEKVTPYSYDLGQVLSLRTSTGIKKAYMGGGTLTDAGMPTDGIAGMLWQDFMASPSATDEGMKAYFEGWLARNLGRPTNFETTLDGFFKALTKDAYSKAKSFETKNPIAKGIYKALETAGKPGFSRRTSALITKAYYRSLLGAALDTSMKNLMQSGNTIGEAGFKSVGKGIIKMLSKEGRKVFRDSGIMDDMVTTMEQQADLISSNKFMKMWDKLIFSPMQGAEYINRGIAYHAGLLEGAKKLGKKATPYDIHRYATRVVEKTQFRYGVTNTSPYLNNPAGKLLYQFSTYPTNQLDFMRTLLKEKGGKGKLFRLLAFQGMALGTTYALMDADLRDPMGWTDTTPPLPALGLAGELAKKVPFVSPLLADSSKMGDDIPKLGPAVQLSGFASPHQRKESLANLIAGSLGIPRRSLRKFMRYLEEKERGEAVTYKGKAKFDLKKGEALMRLLGMHPGSEREYYSKGGK